MEGTEIKDARDREIVSIHVAVSQSEYDFFPEDNLNVFEIPPFIRQTFFRYSLYGQSGLVKSSSIVFASHHTSEAFYLDIKKLSVVLVGGNEIPDWRLYAPTVKEVYFMGHISCPTTAFRMLPRLVNLETVIFNIGFGGYINEFWETAQELHEPTPQVRTVTSFELKLNRQLYYSQPKEIQSIFKRIVKSVMKHSTDSFPSLKNVVVDLPNIPLFNSCTALFLHGNEYLRTKFEVFKLNDAIQVRTKQTQRASSLPFDPCAYIPNGFRFNTTY